MQFAITDDGVLTFADEFYRALAKGSPVDPAVAHARRALAAHSDVGWGTQSCSCASPTAAYSTFNRVAEAVAFVCA